MPIRLPQGELATGGTLTGGGDIAFLATTAGRILKVTLATGALEALFPGVPHCLDPYPMAPGSLANLECNLAGSAAELQGAITMNGVPVPVLYAKDGEIGIQVPWNGHSFFGDALRFEVPTASPFDGRQSIRVHSMVPRFILADPGEETVLGLKWVKADWSGLVTSEPQAGEMVYAYMTGLGTVKGPMITGAPASLTAPEPIDGDLKCRFLPQKDAAETMWAGLAPGTIGIYQVAFRMPADAGASPMTGVTCAWQSASGSGSFFPVP